jgi:alanyl-tRNA synthetase
MDTDTLRQRYLNFFSRRGHKIVPSSPLALGDDPTLLFTSAGMAQFKKEFLGEVSGFQRAASCQRCLRTDDLDKVGVTPFHHTFFEMLGNFSFGDYFKEEAISWAWKFLLEELGMDPNASWVSVYQQDDEAYKIWRHKIKFPEEKIVRLGPKENFWPSNAIEDGPNGPCGPCSEIFFDYGPETGCKRSGCKPGCPCGRFVEIWNLVFTQFNRKDKGVLEPLPNKNIDTGMGLERMASVLQGVKSNFEIDIFKPIIKAIIDHRPSTIDYRLINAIADHIRAVTFAIYDGVIPSNEQRGYVVRKLIRKAGFHGYTLGIKKPFLYTLAAKVAETFGKEYPQLKPALARISQIIQNEEQSFILTLNDAPHILENEFKQVSEGTGHIAFRLYDTHGIPLEVTKHWVRERGIEIDEAQFQQDFRLQQERSKKGSKIAEGIFAAGGLKIRAQETRFLGYHKLVTNDAKILGIVKDSKGVKKALEGESVSLILNKTTFYAEAGGQIGDRGKIVKGKNVFNVEGARKYAKVILHTGRVESGKFRAGDFVSTKVNEGFRRALSRAHTATHLLHWGLRKLLGEHIRQAGSLVEPDRLRFDFIHTQKVSDEVLGRIENLVQKAVMSADEVTVKEISLSQAKKIGALALFEEKYGSKARLVSIGDYSKELCGGTHLKNSSYVGLFKIISEGSIAQGIRRIEALTGERAYQRIKENEEKIKEVSRLIRSDEAGLLSQLGNTLKRLEALEKAAAQLRLESFAYQAIQLIDTSENMNGTRLIYRKYEDVDTAQLRSMADVIRSKAASYALCLVSSKQKGAQMIIALSDDLVRRGIAANQLIKEAAVLINGAGAGKAHLAQAGGSNVSGCDKAIEKFKELIHNHLAQAK